jgi:glucose-6-phosphate dehydrogenase assembly protein OpcA
MTTTLWDTTGGDVVQALLTERRAAGAFASGLAVTLVVVTDERTIRAAEEAGTTAAAAHPSRLLLVVRRQPDAPEPRLDAEVSLGGRLGPTEAVVMRMYGRLALHAESVVLPLLAPDAPVVTWWNGEAPAEIATDPLGVLADRRITDAAAAADPMAALRQRAADYHPGDTDLAWTRTTPWRSLLAVTFDSVEGAASAAEIHARPDDPTAALLAGWLTDRLGITPARVTTTGRLIERVTVTATGSDGEVVVRIDRGEGTARLHRTNQPDRTMPLPQRTVGELLAEEVRRLDADPIYARALATATGRPAPPERPPHRGHVWVEPGRNGGR